MHRYCVPTKLTTSDKMVPYSKHLNNISPNNSSMQREENQLPLAAPTESQISEKLHSIKHKQTLSSVSLNRTSDTRVCLRICAPCWEIYLSHSKLSLNFDKNIFTYASKRYDVLPESFGASGLP